MHAKLASRCPDGDALTIEADGGAARGNRYRFPTRQVGDEIPGVTISEIFLPGFEDM
jgi:hypothetical protein